eukprot:6463106-Amphidinium_carterae.1
MASSSPSFADQATQSAAVSASMAEDADAQRVSRSALQKEHSEPKLLWNLFGFNLELDSESIVLELQSSWQGSYGMPPVGFRRMPALPPSRPINAKIFQLAP